MKSTDGSLPVKKVLCFLKYGMFLYTDRMKQFWRKKIKLIYDTFDYCHVVVDLVAAVVLVIDFLSKKMKHSRVLLEMSLAYCDIFFQKKKKNRARKRRR